ncbi:MAG TPA: uracil phosphoribosyltransferase [Pirellulales bacterium]|jgi:uracil phosphoribosyltransferase|nr:uracil phosphoribosyltransferase [Pirellulales bacterium]
MKTQDRPLDHDQQEITATEIRHPLVRHYLSQLRDVSTTSPDFRQLVRRLALIVAYEATADLAVRGIEVQTPLCVTGGHALAQRIGLFPILRAGLGMVDAVLELLPQAEVRHLGIYRDEQTMQPVEYYSRLPETAQVDVALVLDPMLATGGSALAAVATLAEWGVPIIKVLSIIASREGIEAVEAKYPDTQIFVTAIDPELDDRKYIIPGLGDAGDRTFNTIPRQ